MTYRPVVLHTPRPWSGLHLFEIGERDYEHVMPFVVDHRGKIVQQEFRPRPDIIRSSLVIGPGVTNEHALMTWRWLGTNTKP